MKRLPPWTGLEPPVPDWHRLAIGDKWLSSACNVQHRQASTPPTWTKEEVLRFLATIRTHEGRDTIRAFLIDLLADEIAEIVLATLEQVGAK